jgi:anaerobic selenocysteine-containing dehydrogenase
MAIVSMLTFALFLKMSNGATYGIVPFVNAKNVGLVSGIVGAGGNLGGMLFGFLFKSESITYVQAFTYIGYAVIAVAVIVLYYPFSKTNIFPKSRGPVNSGQALHNENNEAFRLKNNNNGQKKLSAHTRKSTCCYCGVGCGVVLNKKKTAAYTLQGDKDHPVNKGMLCSKGLNLHYTVNDKSDRLLYPQMRYNKSMPMQQVSWDDALDRTAAVFKTFIHKYGPDSVAFYASGQCLTEEYYVVNKLMKGFIGSNNIDTNSRLCMSSAVAAYKIALGEDSVPFVMTILNWPIAFMLPVPTRPGAIPFYGEGWRPIRRQSKCQIIVVDPRATDTCAIADLHLQINPGTDITLNHAIGRVLIENGDIDMNFIITMPKALSSTAPWFLKSTFDRSGEDLRR